MTDDLVGRLRKLLALATPRPWLIHSEPDVNYPATIHAVSTHRLGGVGDPIEPLGSWDQQLAVDAVNAVPALIARIEALEAALRTMIYETTHLSPCEPDGSHWCKISADALTAARQLFSKGPPHAD